MADRLRIEIGFDGAPGIRTSVEASDVDALEKAMAGGEGGVVVLNGDDGTITVAAAKVTYVRRIARESRVGFGAA